MNKLINYIEEYLPQYQIKAGTMENIKDQFQLKQSNSDYFEKIQSHSVTMEECVKDLTDAPEECPAENQYFWHVYNGSKCVALLAYLEGYPKADTVYLGLLVVDKSQHGKGIGRKINDAFMRAALAAGYEKVRLCCYLVNEHGYWFWRKNRYTAIKPVERVEEGVTYQLLIMECDVTAPHMFDMDVKEHLNICKEDSTDYHASEWMTKKSFWNKHHLGCDEHYLVKVVRECEDFVPELTRIAKIGDRVVGGIWYTNAWVVKGEEKFKVLNFGPLCVEPEYQGTGVGGALLEYTKKLAADAGYDGIIIFGEPGYYPKHGFKTCDNFGITTIDGKNFAPFMGCELQPGAFEKMSGGYFVESEAFETLYHEKVKEFDKEFPEMVKMQVPGQWDQKDFA